MRRRISPTEDAIIRAAYSWKAAESHKEEIQRLRELRDAVFADLDSMKEAIAPHRKKDAPPPAPAEGKR